MRRIACVLVVAAGIAGCEGVLGMEGGPRIRIDRDAGMPLPPGIDGGDPGDGGPGPPPTGDDAGTMSMADAGPPPGRDAGPPPDPCMGETAAGRCAGSVATWCEASAIRTRDCAASGMICGDGVGGARCQTPPTPGCGTAVEMEQLRITNAERTAAGLSALVCDEGLTRAARAHSQDMCDQGFFSHDSLDGRTFRDRIDAEGVRWSRIGENIARGQRDAMAVHVAWMGSSGHRANIMSSSFGRIGIGHVACPGSGPYWTQDFAD